MRGYAKLKGLSSSQYNGKTVKVVKYVESKDRWRVKLLSKQNAQKKVYLGVKKENLEPVLSKHSNGKALPSIVESSTISTATMPTSAPTNHGHLEQLQVIGAGFGGTGTETLRDALIHLGYHCYDMRALQQHPQDNDLFIQQISLPLSKRQWNDSLFAPRGYTATVDWPTALFYQQLLYDNPSAKVILTVADTPDEWYTSALNSIYKLSTTREWWQFRLFSFFMRTDWKHKRVVDEIWKGLFGGRFTDQAHAIAVYEKHIENVKNTVPKQQLLILNVKQADWEPLCRFLDVTIPSEPFPTGNGTADKKRHFQELVRRRNKISTVVIIVLLMIIGAVYKSYKYYKAIKNATK